MVSLLYIREVSMIILRYALIVRNEQEKRITVVCTHREPRTGTRHNGVSSSFLRLCRSVFALHPGARSIEVVSLAPWSRGVDVESLPPVLWIEKTEQEGRLACGFPLTNESEVQSVSTDPA